jgi:hypothetical protein
MCVAKRSECIRTKHQVVRIGHRVKRLVLELQALCIHFKKGDIVHAPFARVLRSNRDRIWRDVGCYDAAAWLHTYAAFSSG